MDSNLQIISGKWRGRKLSVPSDARPTQNRARIALFNMLESLGIRPAIVWDAFAGSGAFGIECLSRYGSDVKFTDNSPDSIKTIRKNLLGIGAITVEQVNATDAIKKFGALTDLIFIDPPYAENNMGNDFVKKLSNIAKPGAILIWEMEDKTTSPVIPDGWMVLKDKKYGRARFLILKKA